MSNVLGTLFKDIADAIRGKTGDTATMKPTEFPNKIGEISVGSSDETLMDVIHGLVTRDEEYTSGKQGLLKVPTVLDTDDGKILGSLSSYSLAGFKDALYAQFSNQPWINDYALGYNTKLKLVDFNLTAVNLVMGFVLYQYALYGCTDLESIILRYTSEEACPTETISVGGRSGLEGVNDTFCIYASSAIYDIVVANNPLYSNRIRKLEDYPEIDAWLDNI